MKQQFTLIFSIFALILLSGCRLSSPAYDTGASGLTYNEAGGFDPPRVITGSLFPSDHAVMGDEAIAKLLDGEIKIVENVRIAVLKWPGSSERWTTYSAYRYHDSEEYKKIREQFSTTLMEGIGISDRVAKIFDLPSMLRPDKLTIPHIREAAVRMQADMVLIYYTRSDIYSKWRAFKNNEAKAFADCEALLLDVRTGVVPFSYLTTQEGMAEKSEDDFDIYETRRRAETEALLKCLTLTAGEIKVYFETLP